MKSSNNSANGFANLSNDKFWLAVFVLTVSIFGVIILAGIVLYIGKDINTAQFVFGAILPLLGTWVGTVLAYYFSRENFEAANRSIQAMATHMTPSEKLESISVRQKMIPKNKMVLLQITQANPVENITVVDGILNKLRKENRNRLPILDENGHPIFMIHRSMIDKYLAKLVIEDEMSSDEVNVISLKQLLDKDPELKLMFETSWVTASESSTLADAKNEMDKVKDCLDVFITKNGSKNEPVVGWLTNLIITESAKV